MKKNIFQKFIPSALILAGLLLGMSGAISMAGAQNWGVLKAQLLGYSAFTSMPKAVAYSAGAPSMGAPDASTPTTPTTSTDQTGGTTTPWNTVPPTFIQGLPAKDTSPYSLDSFTLGSGEAVHLWANQSSVESDVAYGSKVWLTWKADTVNYPDITCKSAPFVTDTGYILALPLCGMDSSTSCAAWNGQTLGTSGQVEIGPEIYSDTFNITCNYKVGQNSQTATSAVSIKVGPNPNTFDFNFSVNGKEWDPNGEHTWQTGIYTIGFPFGTALDVKWKANDPSAVCNVVDSPIWATGNKNLPASGEKMIPIDSSTPQSLFGYWDRTFGGGTLMIRMNCTASGQAKGKTFQVYENGARPESWTVTLNGNGQSGTVTVPSGTSVILSWNTNYPKDFVYGHGAQGGIFCDGLGDWSGRKDALSGQQSTGPITSNKSYTIQCQDPNAHMYDSKASLTVLVSSNGSTDNANNNLNGPGLVNGVSCQDSSNTKGLIVWTRSCDYLRAQQQKQPAPAPSTSAGTKTPPAGFEDELNTENPFSDTNTSDICGMAAADLYKRAVIGGFSDGTFRGSELVNRAQAAKFLLLAKGETMGEETGKNPFRDVLKGQWYTNFVLAAARLHIINGYSDGSFKPANPVNTAEFLKMLTLAFGLETNLPYQYTDVKKADWFSAYAGVAEKYDLFPQEMQNCAGANTAHSNTLLNPGKKLTRADVAVAIEQYLNSQN
jgi:hypothetical protein